MFGGIFPGEMSGISRRNFPGSIFGRGISGRGMPGEICTAWVSRSSCRITSRAGASLSEFSYSGEAYHEHS